MRTCWESVTTYWAKPFGFGPALPRGEITICDQFVLIGGGVAMNLYFAIVAVTFGFFFALLLAVLKAHPSRWFRLPASTFVFVMRGSPLILQFFFAYALILMLPREASIQLFGMDIGVPTFRFLSNAWFGALLVLFLNTSAYSAEIFYGALRAVPKGDIEAAKAFGLSPWQRFRRVTLPTLLRLAWPSYTNEAIFLFHATTLVFLSAFPALSQMGEALRYVKYFNAQTFNPFVPYPIIAFYFLIASSLIIFLFGRVNLRLNRHRDPEARVRIHYRPRLLR